ncbi:MAG TPA: O-methyltransferase [Candidatus Polarisedimenticolaceae bacterium]|nr:O-methyltransferase [Candidatus Polarisedimenticolaceae bacterium]
MEIVDPSVERYLHRLADSPDPILREMEALAAERRFPIVGPAVGRLLALLARMIRARRVIELGSGFGYSAHWFARAVGAEGLVVLTDRDGEHAAEAAEFLRRAGLLERTRIETGNALQVIDRVDGEFDIVFNDIDKRDYPRVLDKAAAVLRPGGLLISDNMLWRGAVLDAETADPATRGVRDLTDALYASDRFETVLLPLRDGVTVSSFRG